uniref:Uncharacterized protein n=1 Tax=Steinernema glaseri TaxID=37863 RepID=A0A1I7XY11_9BILA
MRSTVGPLAALLLLFCCSVTTASHEKVIACGTYYGTYYIHWRGPSVGKYYFFAKKWSAETSDFVNVESSLSDCGLETIGSLCRRTYKNVSYGLDLNVTKNILVEMPYPRKREAVEAKLFKCQDYIRAPEPEVPEGSWSDRLSLVSEGSCMSEAEWLTASTEECGKKPTNYVLGAQCGDQDKYLEVIFVCDKPRNDTNSEMELDLLAIVEDYLINLKSVLFRALRKMGGPWQEDKWILERHWQEDVSGHLHAFWDDLFKTLQAVQTVHSSASGKRVFTTHKLGKRYTSRQFLLSQAKEYVKTVGDKRWEFFFNLALRMVIDIYEIIPDLVISNLDEIIIDDMMKYDAENFIENQEEVFKGKHFAEHVERFPELREQINAYYIEYVKDHTPGIARKHLGFLNESGAHARLCSMYKEIFRSGFIDQKYMDTLSAESSRPSEKPTNYVLGAQCDNEETYLEVTFTCDKPRIDVYTDFLEARREHHRKMGSALLKHVLQLTETESPDTYEGAFQYTLFMAVYVILSTDEARDSMPRYAREYTSRELLLAQAKKSVVEFAHVRSFTLAGAAGYLLMNLNQTEIPLSSETAQEFWMRFDAQNFMKIVEEGSRDAFFIERLQLFPELKEPLTAYYVKYIKDHTPGIAREHLGFLNETYSLNRARARIAQLVPFTARDRYGERSLNEEWGVIVEVRDESKIWSGKAPKDEESDSKEKGEDMESV